MIFTTILHFKLYSFLLTMETILTPFEKFLQDKHHSIILPIFSVILSIPAFPKLNTALPYYIRKKGKGTTLQFPSISVETNDMIESLLTWCNNNDQEFVVGCTECLYNKHCLWETVIINMSYVMAQSDLRLTSNSAIDLQKFHHGVTNIPRNIQKNGMILSRQSECTWRYFPLPTNMLRYYKEFLTE